MPTIAARLDRDPSAVVRLELGDSRIPADDLPVVLQAYGLTVNDFAKAAKERAA